MGSLLETIMQKLGIFAVALLCAGFAMHNSLAQSGRRSAKPASPPVPTPTAEPTATPKASPSPAERREVTVGMDSNGGFQNFPPYFYTSAQQLFIKQLSEDNLLRVIDGGDMNRGEATKKAKNEKDGYVVYLQLRLETYNPGARSNDSRDVIVEYYLIAPTSTKVVASGQIYARMMGRRGILRAPTSGVYNDYFLEEAAKAAAEEVEEYFKHHRTGPFD